MIAYYCRAIVVLESNLGYTNLHDLLLRAGDRRWASSSIANHRWGTAVELRMHAAFVGWPCWPPPLSVVALGSAASSPGVHCGCTIWHGFPRAAFSFMPS